MIVPFKLETGVFIYIDLQNRNRVFEALKFDFIQPFNKDGLSIVKENEKYGLVNMKGSLVIPIIYDSILSISEEHILIILNSKYGILDINGKLIIPLIHENLSNVKNGLILFANEEDLYKDLAVNDNIKYGYLNLMNEIVIEPQFTPAEDFSEGLAVVGKYFGLDEDYNSIIKYGFIDTKGDIKIDFQYDFASSFYNGKALIIKDEVEFYIDNIGNKIENVVNPIIKENINPIKFIQKHHVETSFGDKGLIETYGYKDKFGKIVIKPIYTFAEDFKDGLAKVTIDNNTFYILPNGEELCQRKISY